MKSLSSVINNKTSIEKNKQILKKLYEELEKGNTIQEETRRFDEKQDRTILMRVKETGNDYRYFPEPDLAPIVLSEEYIENIKNSLPEMPESRKQRSAWCGI